MPNNRALEGNLFEHQREEKMIRFRSKKHKIIFLVLVPILVLGAFVYVYAIYRPPEVPNISCLTMVCVVPVTLCVWLLMYFFTEPTSSDANRRLSAMWGCGSASLLFLSLSITAIFFGSRLRRERCQALAPNVSLWQCSYVGEDLSGTNLHGTNMRETSLVRANLSDADLTGVTLTNADLREANLSNANLTRAELQGADLSNAELYDASLDGATLDGANLSNASGLTNEMLGSAASWRGTLLQTPRSMLVELATVCTGEGIEEAAPYAQDNSRHPLVLLQQDGKQHELSQQIPPTWWPATTSYAELVACVGVESEHLVQTCRYEKGGVAYRYVQEQEVQVVEAVTGEVLALVTVSGPEPRGCPDKLLTVEGVEPEEEYRGESPGIEEYIKALSRFVNADGEMEPLQVPEP